VNSGLQMVIRLGLWSWLPRSFALHVARIIGAATFERKDVVDDVTRAGTGCGLGRRAGVAGLEGAPSCGAAADVAAGAPLASFAETRGGLAIGRLLVVWEWRMEYRWVWAPSRGSERRCGSAPAAGAIASRGTRRIGYDGGVTAEERFERIETSLEAFDKGMLVVQQTLIAVMQSAERTQNLVGTLVETTAHYIEASDARMKESEARAKVLEDRFQTLIQIIAAEHGNGKGKLP
jgi:hypothetical protein